MASSKEDYCRLNLPLLLQKYYSKTVGPKADTLLKFTQFLQNRNTPGNRYLDFGTGAAVHTLITPAKFYDDITVTYYTDGEKTLMAKWINGDEDCFDWSQWFQIVMQCEHPEKGLPTENEIKERMELVRSKIKRVLPCDISNDEIVLSSEKDVLYDAISSSGCLESACQNYEEYCLGAKKLCDLLAPGGILLLIGNIECTFYKIGDQKFHVVKMTKEQIEDAFKNAGLSDFNWYITETHYYDSTEIDLKGYFLMTAVKNV